MFAARRLPAFDLPRFDDEDREFATRIALVVAVALAMRATTLAEVQLTVIVVLAATLVLASQRSLGWTVIVVLLAVGIALRLGVSGSARFGSDVLDVTSAALQGVLHGLNPWGHGYAETRPPGAPYPYGPLGLFWYLPNPTDPRSIEQLISFVILGLLALRGRPLGLAIYATAPVLIVNATDGSNDSSAGLLLLAALVLASRSVVVGGVFLGAAVAFKPYALAWVPAYVVWGGLPALAAFLGASVVAWGPAFLAWSPGAFLTSLGMAEETQTHHAPFWSFGVIWEGVLKMPAPELLLNRARFVLGGAVALVTLRLVKSLDGVIVAGTLVFLVTLFAGYWSSFAYFGAIAPILCWHADEWLGVIRKPTASDASALPAPAT